MGIILTFIFIKKRGKQMSFYLMVIGWAGFLSIMNPDLRPEILMGAIFISLVKIAHNEKQKQLNKRESQ